MSNTETTCVVFVIWHRLSQTKKKHISQKRASIWELQKECTHMLQVMTLNRPKDTSLLIEKGMCLANPKKIILGHPTV
jgi:hypothetical protein